MLGSQARRQRCVLAEVSNMVAKSNMRIAVIGGGPGGLYFAILMKLTSAGHQIEVFERNRHDDTYGFGVVFSDETLSNFEHADPPSYRAIVSKFCHWTDIDVHVRGTVIRSGGHGFCGLERKTLLLVLQERARQLGVRLHFQREITDETTLAGYDLVVAADGINSAIREKYRDHFQPRYDLRKNMFVWLGSTRSLPSFTFAFKENDCGVWILGAYMYKPGYSTWVPECSPETWKAAGLDRASEQESVAYLEELWADLLDGHKLLTNRSIWRQFPMIKNEHWYRGNLVLLGDALHTAHYSIGSGTKLAMEDALALRDACVLHANDVAAALPWFEAKRREDVEKTQHAADVSLSWFETPRRFWKLEPTQLVFSLLSRSKQITYENLGRRDGEFMRNVDRWWATSVRKQGFDVPFSPPPPMFTPFRLRAMDLQNRVMVSPMGMYSADDGTPTSFHLVHLGSFALGGAGLVYTETTHISRESRITPGCCGMYKPEHVRAWREITQFVHTQSGAKICMQLGHAGRKGSTRRGWEGMDLPLEDGNWPIYSASPIPFTPLSQTPIEIDRAEMTRVREQFVAAAKMCEAAGFDMIELHMAHGYLLSSFISPLTNLRTDEYGGDLEHRMRYPLEVFDAVRAVWRADKPMAVRISATDWLEGGLTSEMSVEIARMFKVHGLDIVDVSAGQTTSYAEPVYGRMFQTPFSDAIRSDAGIATMTVGNITSADQVNTIIAAGRADIVALARPHLADPHFVLKAAAHYGWEGQRWPIQYGSAKEQAFRLAQRARADDLQLREAVKPKLAAQLAADTRAPRNAAEGAT